MAVISQRHVDDSRNPWFQTTNFTVKMVLFSRNPWYFWHENSQRVFLGLPRLNSAPYRYGDAQKTIHFLATFQRWFHNREIW